MFHSANSTSLFAGVDGDTKTQPFRPLSFVNFYRRRLPHLYQIGPPVFLTWRVYGSLPLNRSFAEATVGSGESFAALDRLLEQTRTGPFYLQQPAIAGMILDVLNHNANVLRWHTLHAFAVMPNHVHLLVRANQMLARTGNPFWQKEGYDHLVRGSAEGERIRSYIEQDPVRAGLAQKAKDYHCSSAPLNPGSATNLK